MKKAFTIVEIAIVFVLLLLTAYLVIPSLLDDTKQAESVSQWKYAYHNLEYMFSAVSAQLNKSDIEAFVKAEDNKQREMLLFEYLKPFMRTKTAVGNEEYKTYFMNSSPVKPDDYYYFTNLHITNSDNIIGLKWMTSPENIRPNLPIALLLFDINGLKKPNKWGEDIFGINIFADRIEPFGKHLDDDVLKRDCSKKGTGIYCSYYYYTYGSYIE